jgi:hypothetical protein
VAALLIKPLLDLRIFEHGDTESSDYRDGDDDAWSVALADKSRYNVPTPESLVCFDNSRSPATHRVRVSCRNMKDFWSCS